MLLNKNNFNELIKRKTKIVECGEFTVKIQSLLLDDQLMIEKLNAKENKEGNEVILLMLKLSCVDEDGNNILDDSNIKQLPSQLALDLFTHCLELNGLSDKELEIEAKNF